MTRKRRNITWTEDEEIYLITNYEITKKKILAEKMGRPTGSITGKYAKLLKEFAVTGRHKEVFEKAKELEIEFKRQKEIERKERKKVTRILWQEEQDERELWEKEEEYRLKVEAEKKKYEQIYKNAIKKEIKNRDYGIGKTLKNTNYILGKTYIVKSSSKKSPELFKGKLIQQTQDYIVLECRHRQCYMKKDFLIGEYEIKEVRN